MSYLAEMDTVLLYLFDNPAQSVFLEEFACTSYLCNNYHLSKFQVLLYALLIMHSLVLYYHAVMHYYLDFDSL